MLSDSAPCEASAVTVLAEQVRDLVRHSVSAKADTVVPLKETTSQVSEATAVKLSADELVKCYARWAKIFGSGPQSKRPPLAEDPSPDQLSSLSHLLKNANSMYVDFCVWGPMQQRTVKRKKLIGLVPNARGEWVQVELLGPATYGMWKACWKVFANACILLNAVDLGNLLSYANYLEDFVKRYGEKVYPLLYQADNRTSAEQMPRMYLEEHAKYLAAVDANSGVPPDDYPFDPDRPWNFLFQKLTDGSMNTSWWDKELERPALLLTCSGATVPDVLGTDALVGTSAQREAPAGLDSQVALAADTSGVSSGRPAVVVPRGGRVERPAPKPKARTRNRQHHVDPTGTYYTHSRSGHQICMDYNGSGCGAAIEGSWCPNGNGLHQCCRCGGRHPVTQCPHDALQVPNWVGRKGEGNGSGGGKGGKGKGGKSGKGKGGSRSYRSAPYIQR